MDASGISNDDHVVIYGREGCVFTPRTHFLFRSLGHDPSRVHLMQGSFEEWARRGGAVNTGPTTVPFWAEDLVALLKGSEGAPPSPPRYRARDAANVCSLDRVMAALNEVDDKDGEDTLILDPRGTSFAGGHIPGAINVPYLSIVEADDWLKFRPREDLLGVFLSAGVDVATDRPVILTCGSGVSVCHLFLALEECGRDNSNTVIYDGSWAEWGSESGTPKVVDKEGES